MQCCGAGAGRSRGFLAGTRADLKFELEPEPIFLGRLRLLFWQVKLYIFLYTVIKSTGTYLLTLPTVSIKYIKLDTGTFFETEYIYFF